MTMQIPIDITHFCAGQGALSVMYHRYMSESATQSCEKVGMSRRVGLLKRPCGVAYHLFGFTKPRSARLAWSHWKANAGFFHGHYRSYYVN
jgi:hypothetical protein